MLVRTRRRIGTRMAAERTIVVVDEDRANCSLVELALAGPDRAVVGFCDAQSAFEFIEGARHVDVVVSDAAIAGSDGRSLWRRLRSNPKTAATRVIIVSTDDGGLDQIRKPFEIAELRRRVDAAIAQKVSPDDAIESIGGLATREHFERAVEEAQTAAAQSGSAIAVMAAAVQDFDALVARFGGGARARADRVDRQRTAASGRRGGQDR
jgi:CheY-like chemotaxis protein